MSTVPKAAQPPFRFRRGERGATIVLFTIMAAMVVIPMIGLGVDVGIMFWARAKLSAAVDAAALAAGRDITNASTLAPEYVYANLPAGWAGTSYSSVPSALVTNPSPGLHTVAINAAVTVPLYFMRFIGKQSATVSASGSSSRRDTNVILVLDRSYSMQIAGVCSTLVTSAESFVNKFSNGLDTLGLVSFSTTANVDFSPSSSFQPGLNNILKTATCTGFTTTAAALNLAYTQIQNIPNAASDLNVIVLFTDGIPDSIQAQFQGNGNSDATNIIKQLQDYRYAWNSSSTSTVQVNASTCGASSNFTGVVVDTIGTTSPPPVSGETGGIYNTAGISISSSYPANSNYSYNYLPGLLPAVVTPNCGSFGSNDQEFRYDIAYLPTSDAFGNLLTGFRTVSSDYFQTGNPYVGQLRSDSPQAIMHAAENAADAQALTIRSDATYKPYIYTIGLGGTSSQPRDDTLLERIANDPRSTNYNSSLPIGEYIPCTAASLTSAFQQVASQVLHLSK